MPVASRTELGRPVNLMGGRGWVSTQNGLGVRVSEGRSGMREDVEVRIPECVV